MAKTRGREIPKSDEITDPVIERLERAGKAAYNLGWIKGCLFMGKIHLASKDYDRALKCINDAEAKLREIEL